MTMCDCDEECEKRWNCCLRRYGVIYPSEAQSAADESLIYTDIELSDLHAEIAVEDAEPYDLFQDAASALGCGWAMNEYGGTEFHLPEEGLVNFVRFVQLAWEKANGEALIEHGRQLGRKDVIDAMTQAKSSTLN